MERLKCDVCRTVYSDEKDIETAKNHAERWKQSCVRDGTKARGVAPCPNITCSGELLLEGDVR